MKEVSDRELLDALGVELDQAKARAYSATEERVMAGFEQIQRFVDENGGIPQHGEDRDVFERLYAVRLDRLRGLPEYHPLLEPLDHQGLLSVVEPAETGLAQEGDDRALLAQLGVDPTARESLTELRHVRSAAEKRAAEEVANRQRCEDFKRFKPLFDKVQSELDAGIRRTRSFELKAEIRPGAWFVVGGQKAYVAETAEPFLNAQGMTDARLRVIFDNSTESNMLMRSLQRALNKDKAGRRITDPNAGPLFSDQEDDADLASGTIYVLRSKSDHPLVAASRDLVHKIGVTNIDVAQRIAGAHLQPTFLMADVEVVATYDLFNINRTKLEKLIHRVFEPARLDIEVKDRFGRPVLPREWFLVPRFVIDEAVDKIRDGSIKDFTYDPVTAALVHAD